MRRPSATSRRRHSAKSPDDEETAFTTGSFPEAIMDPATNDDTDDDNDLSSIAEIEADEVAALPTRFPPQELRVAQELLRLHRSLRGPQAGLEAAGNFNRPPFPARRRPRTFLGDS